MHDLNFQQLLFLNTYYVKDGDHEEEENEDGNNNNINNRGKYVRKKRNYGEGFGNATQLWHYNKGNNNDG